MNSHFRSTYLNLFVVCKFQIVQITASSFFHNLQRFGTINLVKIFVLNIFSGHIQIACFHIVLQYRRQKITAIMIFLYANHNPVCHHLSFFITDYSMSGSTLSQLCKVTVDTHIVHQCVYIFSPHIICRAKIQINAKPCTLPACHIFTARAGIFKGKPPSQKINYIIDSLKHSTGFNIKMHYFPPFLSCCATALKGKVTSTHTYERNFHLKVHS